MWARFKWTVVGLLVQIETRREYLSLTNRICYSRANPTNSENQWNMPNRWLFSFSNASKKHSDDAHINLFQITRSTFHLATRFFYGFGVERVEHLSIHPSIFNGRRWTKANSRAIEREGEGARASPNQWICWFLCTHNGICFAIKWLPGNAISTECLSMAFAFIVVSAAFISTILDKNTKRIESKTQRKRVWFVTFLSLTLSHSLSLRAARTRRF